MSSPSLIAANDLPGVLETVLRGLSREDAVARDPIRYPRRYSHRQDKELASLYAGFLAFGRVGLFSDTLDAWFAWMDTHGGPAAATAAIESVDTTQIAELYYRWIRGIDLIHFMATMNWMRQEHGELEHLFRGPRSLKERLHRVVDEMYRGMRITAPIVGRSSDDAELPRAMRYLVSHPRSGSACKRWNMVLRWLVREDDGVDLGLWNAIAPSELVMPLDVHVLRVSGLIGLTRRKDNSWRTAKEITDGLRRISPTDPVRFDFAIAHLGISSGCKGKFDAAICPDCALRPRCAAAMGQMVR